MPSQWRRNKVRHAESMRQEAEDELEHAKDKAVREVWKAYDDTKVALVKHQAAAALLAASDKAWSAMLESYQHGLATLPDVRESERNLARARTLDQSARGGADAGRCLRVQAPAIWRGRERESIHLNGALDKCAVAEKRWHSFAE